MSSILPNSFANIACMVSPMALPSDFYGTAIRTPWVIVRLHASYKCFSTNHTNKIF